MIHKVRAHLRTSRGGVSHLVWEHYRTRGGRPLYFKVYDPETDFAARDAFIHDTGFAEDPGINAFVLTDDPDTIYLTHAAARDMRGLPSVLSHETLHATLQRLGEHQASTDLDQRRDLVGAASIIMEPSGLYRYSPKRKPR